MSTADVFNVIDEPLAQELEEIFRNHYTLVYRTAYSVTGNPQDAEDVVQNLFVGTAAPRMPARAAGRLQRIFVPRHDQSFSKRRAIAPASHKRDRIAVGCARCGDAPESRPAFAALQDQLGKLGLRLQSAKVPDEFIVIEHAELPTEN